MWVSVLRLVHDRAVIDDGAGLVCPCAASTAAAPAVGVAADAEPTRRATLRLTLVPPAGEPQPETAW